MSETPITDAAVFDANHGYGDKLRPVVDADLCREIEMKCIALMRTSQGSAMEKGKLNSSLVAAGFAQGLAEMQRGRAMGQEKAAKVKEKLLEVTPSTVDRSARWEKILEMSKAIAHRDGIHTETEAALCGAVVRAREFADEVMKLRGQLNAALIAAGVASMERGEWQAQRAGLYVLIREAVLATIDRHEWDFSDDADRVDFADMVIAFLPTAKEK